MAKSYIGIRKLYDGQPNSLKSYLKHLDTLVDSSEKYELALAYIFMKLEEGNHRSLKCGLVRLHKCNSSSVNKALERQHFTRKYFRTVFQRVFSKPIPKTAIENLESAEKTRDRLIHGKTVKASELRTAISNALSYIAEAGSFVETLTDKNPYGDLRGLTGRMETLDDRTSYWVLKGVGLYADSDGPI